jgi:hypothetical protein
MDTEKFQISVALGNALVQYLSTRPYAEVSGLINELQQAHSMTLAKENKKEKDV